MYLAEVHGNRTHLGRFQRPTLDLKSRRPTSDLGTSALGGINTESPVECQRQQIVDSFRFGVCLKAELLDDSGILVVQSVQGNCQLLVL